MKRYNKLVRDRIPEIIKKDGQKANVRVATDQEYEAKLFEKLNEEVSELVDSKSVDEMSDVYEVLEAIAKKLGFGQGEIIKLKNKKAKERGRFERRIILIEISD